MVAVNLSFLFVKEFPVWFKWFAAGIQSLGIVVCFLISFLGYKAYELLKDRKYKYFFYGFLLLGCSFLANLILNVLLRLGYAKYIVENRYLPYVAPLFFIYYFFLIGVMLAYVSFAVVYGNMKRTSKIWLFYFWTLVIGSYTFRDTVLFNMFSAVLISFTILLTFEKYKGSKNKNRLLTFIAFICLFLFHALAIFEKTMPIFYAIRYIILLTGLVTLLITMQNIYGRAKK